MREFSTKKKLRFVYQILFRVATLYQNNLRFLDKKRVEIEDGRLASEITQMLMGSEVGPRRQFIYDHADEAEIDA